MIKNIKQAYEILGVSEYATKEETKKAYRTLCKTFHPDRNSSPNAVKHYIEVQQAYELIVQLERYREKISKSESQTTYSVFYKNTYMAGNKTTSKVENWKEKSGQRNNSHSHFQSSSGEKILGGTPSYMRKYEEIQQRNAQKRKLEREREAQQKEQKRKAREEVAARIKTRKLPSEKEAERREKIAVQKEAERIAGMIERLMRL